MADPSDLVSTPRDSSCPSGCKGVHSYTEKGTRWCARGEGVVAIDAETTLEPPSILVRRLTTGEEFWRAWTRLEVVAKMTAIPVLTLLSQDQLGLPGPSWLEVEYRLVGDTLICLGRRI